MQDILNELDQAINNCPLFDLWQYELKLRRRARELTPDSLLVEVNRSEQMDFLYRALYFNQQRASFWSILVHNLNKMPVLTWLSQSSRTLQDDFWNYLPWYIYTARPLPEGLQFLVNLYRPEYMEAYTRIVNAMNLECCRFLLTRSANPEMRQLLKQREEVLITNRQQSLYGFQKTDTTSIYPTMYGDKIEVLLQALQLLQNSAGSEFADPYGTDRVLLLLDAYSRVFECGLVDDCLVLLKELYDDFQQKNRVVNVLDDERIFQAFHRLLRRVIPVYALQHDSVHAAELSKDIYCQHFPRLNEDPASALYLQAYKSILGGRIHGRPTILYEFYLKISRLKRYRPEEIPLLTEAELNTGIDRLHVQQLLVLTRQKIAALPHEAFILLEYICLGQQLGILTLDQPSADQALQYYLLLWNWMPSPLFLNQDILDRLIPYSSELLRSQAERIRSDVLDLRAVQNEVLKKPHLSKKSDANIKRQILSAVLLEVQK